MLCNTSQCGADIFLAGTGQYLPAQFGGMAADVLDGFLAGRGQVQMLDPPVGLAAAALEQSFVFHVVNLPDQCRGFYAHVLRQFAVGAAVVARQVQQQQPAGMGKSRRPQPPIQFDAPGMGDQMQRFGELFVQWFHFNLPANN